MEYQNVIREQDPLKQGLKPLHIPISPEAADIREQDPLKQGLKPLLPDASKPAMEFVSKIH